MEGQINLYDTENPYDAMRSISEPQSAQELICWLTYCSYRTQRDMNPNVSADRWAKAFGTAAPKLEEIYQRELKRRAERVEA